MPDAATPQGGPADAPECPHVLVVDDDDRLRELLRRYLAERGFLVVTAASAAEARRQLSSLRFDVMVLDVMMPGEDGLSLARALRADMGLPILMLTAMDSVEDRIAGLESGVDDYLVKPFEPRELVLRLQAILRRALAPAAAAVADVPPVRFGPFLFDRAAATLTQDGKPVALTTQEASLLELLAASAGRAVTRADLAGGAVVGERTVDVQITRLRRKIEPNPRNPRYLITVRGAGYALKPG